MYTYKNPHNLTESTLKTLKEKGYDTLRDYLLDLTDQYGVPFSVVCSLYKFYGESELFDGLVSALEDAEMEFAE